VTVLKRGNERFSQRMERKGESGDGDDRRIVKKKYIYLYLKQRRGGVGNREGDRGTQKNR